MWTVFATLLVLPSPNSQWYWKGAVPPVTSLENETVSGIVPDVGAAAMDTASAVAESTSMLADAFPVCPAESRTSRRTTYAPGCGYWCIAIFVVDQVVSQTSKIAMHQYPQPGA